MPVKKSNMKLLCGNYEFSFSISIAELGKQKYSFFEK